MGTAGAVLDDDQRVDAAEQHRVHVDEVGRNDAAGLDGQELLPPADRGVVVGPCLVALLADGCGDPLVERPVVPLQGDVGRRLRSVRIAASATASGKATIQDARVPAWVVTVAAVPRAAARACHRRARAGIRWMLECATEVCPVRDHRCDHRRAGLSRESPVRATGEACRSRCWFHRRHAVPGDGLTPRGARPARAEIRCRCSRDLSGRRSARSWSVRRPGGTGPWPVLARRSPSRA